MVISLLPLIVEAPMPACLPACTTLFAFVFCWTTGCTQRSILLLLQESSVSYYKGILAGKAQGP
jgi:hypothetical protein